MTKKKEKEFEEKVNTEKGHFLIITIVLILAFVGFLILSEVPEGNVDIPIVSDKNVMEQDAQITLEDNFAACLTRRGTRMYGAFWCSHCDTQKKLFGNAWKQIEYIECSKPDRTQNALCTKAGIKSYPTWEFQDGTRVLGVQSFATLELKTGCKLIP